MGIGEISYRQKGIFLDRDGVLNELVYNPVTDAYESPHKVEDLKICDNIFGPLKELIRNNYRLFIVSNQPSYAKGKTTLEAIKRIADDFEQRLFENGVVIEKSYYCYHHSEGAVPGFSVRCECRKPSPFFLLQAQKDFNIDMGESWMIGDRDSDVECGRLAGCRTVMIKNPYSASYQGKSSPDYIANSLSEAVYLYILKKEQE